MELADSRSLPCLNSILVPARTFDSPFWTTQQSRNLYRIAYHISPPLYLVDTTFTVPCVLESLESVNIDGKLAILLHSTRSPFCCLVPRHSGCMTDFDVVCTSESVLQSSSALFFARIKPRMALA